MGFPEDLQKVFPFGNYHFSVAGLMAMTRLI